MPEPEPTSIRLLKTLAATDARNISPRAAYARLGVSVRAGNQALARLKEAGLVEGTGRWVRLTQAGHSTAEQLPVDAKS